MTEITAFSSPPGSIGIASIQAKPSLSVMYPGTDKPPLNLSRDDAYRSAFFITISDQEHLAAACRDGIFLWNLADNTSKVVYKFEKSGGWRLCVIDEGTVACVSEEPSSDGFIYIHIIKIDAQMWTLSSSQFVKEKALLSDIPFVKTTDGTACLLLSFVNNNLTQCLEMVGGRVQWQVVEEQIGASFLPWSICTDGSTLFVVDAVGNKLYLLSVEDGSVLRSISLGPFDIHFTGYVQLQGEHLYIAHEKSDTYCISKFTIPIVL